MRMADTRPPSWPRLVDEVVARPGQKDVGVDARHLVGLAFAAEQVHVGLGLPGPEPGTGPGARGAALLSVRAVVEAQFVFEVEGLCRRRARARSRSRRGGRTMTQPAQPVHSPLVITSSNSSFHW